MNEYPPGEYISAGMARPPAPGPDVPPQTVEIDAGHLWGRFRITFIVARNPKKYAYSWTMESGKRLGFGE